MLDANRCCEIVVRLTDLAVEEQDGSGVIISHCQGVCKAVTVNENGLRIWKLVDERRTLGDIVAVSVGRWACEDRVAEQVRQDVVAFLDALALEGCVRLIAVPVEEIGRQRAHTA